MLCAGIPVTLIFYGLVAKVVIDRKGNAAARIVPKLYLKRPLLVLNQSWADKVTPRGPAVFRRRTSVSNLFPMRVLTK